MWLVKTKSAGTQTAFLSFSRDGNWQEWTDLFSLDLLLSGFDTQEVNPLDW